MFSIYTWMFFFISNRFPSHCFHSSSSSNSSNKSESVDVAPNTLINTFPRAPSTSDSIRLKCREMLANALQTGGNLISTPPPEYEKKKLFSIFTVFSCVSPCRGLYCYWCWLRRTRSTDWRIYPFQWMFINKSWAENVYAINFRLSMEHICI